MPKSLVEIHLDLLVVVKTLQVTHQTGAAPLEVNQEGACHHTSIFFDFLYTIWQYYIVWCFYISGHFLRLCQRWCSNIIMRNFLPNSLETRLLSFLDLWWLPNKNMWRMGHLHGHMCPTEGLSRWPSFRLASGGCRTSLKRFNDFSFFTPLDLRDVSGKIFFAGGVWGDRSVTEKGMDIWMLI